MCLGTPGSNASPWTAHLCPPARWHDVCNYCLGLKAGEPLRGWTNDINKNLHRQPIYLGLIAGINSNELQPRRGGLSTANDLVG